MLLSELAQCVRTMVDSVDGTDDDPEVQLFGNGMDEPMTLTAVFRPTEGTVILAAISTMVPNGVDAK